MRRITLTGWVMTVAMAVMVAASGAANASLLDYGWKLTDLGSFIPKYLNNEGQIAGSLFGRPALWSDHVVTELGPGAEYVTAINDHGQVVGHSTTDRTSPSMDRDQMAFQWHNGTLSPLPNKGYAYTPYAINNSGLSVGFSIAGDNTGVMQTLPNTSWPSYPTIVWSDMGLATAADINDLGQIVGRSYGTFSRLPQGARLWDNSGVHLLPFDYAVAINNGGKVVGVTGSRAYLWDSGKITDIGPAYFGTKTSVFSYGHFTLTNHDQVVGTGLPYIWDNGTKVDPNQLVSATGWTSLSVVDINDQGQMVGSGTNPYHQSRTFLLTPTPIPAMLPLMASGLTALFCWHRRQKK